MTQDQVPEGADQGSSPQGAAWWLPAHQLFLQGHSKQQLHCSRQPQLSYHTNVLTMLTAYILLHTLAENPKRKLDGSKYSHTPDKLFCTPSVHSQPPARLPIFLKSYSTI